jgi:nicotinamide mononucleotide transporter
MDFFNSSITSGWLTGSFLWVVRGSIEILATLTGLIYLIYSIAGDKRLWIYGILTSGLYVYVFFKSGIYADMGINVYYVLVSIYGWLHWTYFKNEKNKDIPYSRTKMGELAIIILVTGILFGVILYILKNFTNSTVPYLDSLLTACSITATWMLARKIIEHWLIWIMVDFISIGLYIYKGLYPTTILFLVYTVLAFTGFIEWKKKWQEQQAA